MKIALILITFSLGIMTASAQRLGDGRKNGPDDIIKTQADIDSSLVKVTEISESLEQSLSADEWRSNDEMYEAGIKELISWNNLYVIRLNPDGEIFHKDYKRNLERKLELFKRVPLSSEALVLKRHDELLNDIEYTKDELVDMNTVLGEYTAKIDRLISAVRASVIAKDDDDEKRRFNVIMTNFKKAYQTYKKLRKDVTKTLKKNIDKLEDHIDDLCVGECTFYVPVDRNFQESDANVNTSEVEVEVQVVTDPVVQAVKNSSAGTVISVIQ